MTAEVLSVCDVAEKSTDGCLDASPSDALTFKMNGT